MAKFCGNCGAASDDNANICGNCGAPFAASKNGAGNILSKIPGVSNININSDQKALITKIAKIAVPAIAAIVAVIIVITCLIIPHTGAQGAMRKYFKAVQNADASAIAEFVPAAIANRDNFEESLDEELDLIQETIEDRYGEGYKYKFKDVKAKKLDKDDLEEYEEDYDEIKKYNKDLEVPEISAGYRIKCELVLKGDKRDKDGKCTVIMLKEDGKWVVWSVDTQVPVIDNVEYEEEENYYDEEYYDEYDY